MFRAGRWSLPIFIFLIFVSLWNMDFAGLGQNVYLPLVNSTMPINAMNFYLISFLIELGAFLAIYKKTIVIPIYLSGMFTNLILFYLENHSYLDITLYGQIYNTIMWFVMIPALLLPILYEWYKEKKLLNIL